MTAYYIERGILLYPEDEDFDEYNNVFDCEYGYCNDYSFLVVREELEAVAAAQTHVLSLGGRAYAIVLKANVPYDYDFEKTYGVDDMCTKFEIDNIVYSVRSSDGSMTHNFIIGQNPNSYFKEVTYTPHKDSRDAEVCLIELEGIIHL